MAGCPLTAALYTTITRVVDRRHRRVDLHVRAAGLSMGATEEQRKAGQPGGHHLSLLLYVGPDDPSIATV